MQWLPLVGLFPIVVFFATRLYDSGKRKAWEEVAEERLKSLEEKQRKHREEQIMTQEEVKDHERRIETHKRDLKDEIKRLENRFP